MLGPVDARRKSGWSRTRSTSLSPICSGVPCPLQISAMAEVMTFSTPSKPPEFPADGAQCSIRIFWLWRLSVPAEVSGVANAVGEAEDIGGVGGAGRASSGLARPENEIGPGLGARAACGDDFGGVLSGNGKEGEDTELFLARGEAARGSPGATDFGV